MTYDGKISDIIQDLSNNDIEILNFSKSHESLEDEFLKITGGTK